MVIQQKEICSFFKRKRDELNIENEAVGEEQSSAPYCAPLIEVEVEHNEQEQEQEQAQLLENRRQSVMFRGIEFLERDPALRPQIWEYPSNQQNEVQRAYLKLVPMQPKLKNYKASGSEGHKHRFQHHWFSEFSSWLEYSESNGCAYCLPCFVCSKNIKKRGGFDAFTAQGFSSWKKVYDRKNCALLVHIGSDPCSAQQFSSRMSSFVE